MSTTSLNHRAVCAAVVLSTPLTSCGGGGSSTGGGASAVVAAPTPTPTPSPSPSPAPTKTPLAVPPALTQIPDFAVLSVGDDVAFRYNMSTARHEFMFGTSGWGVLGQAYGYPQSNAYAYATVTFGAAAGALTLTMDMFVPGATNRTLALSHTSFASYCCQPATGQFAYGVPTAPTAVPPAGTYRYRGVLFDPDGLPGAVDITIDYATARVSGTIAPLFNDFGRVVPVGSYPFEGSLKPGTATFEGSFPIGATGRTGTIEGTLTGPTANELMFRWKATLLISNFSSQPVAYTLFGVAKAN